VRASQGFRSFWGAYRTIQGYEAVHVIRKGQASPDFSSTAPTYKWGGAKWAEMSGTRF
jgi:hypothetical protein